jgi:arylsulfatase A-like enzyme
MHRYTGQTFYRNNGKEELVEGFAADAEMAELRTWLSDHKSDPFFLYYNISQPHMPVWDCPEQYRDMYSPDQVELRANVWKDGELPYDENWFKIYLHDYLYYNRHLPYTEQLPEGFDLKKLTALYYGMISWADYQVGELMRNLERNGLADNTIVVFTSDHGDMLGSHGYFNKDSLYEEAIRVPMIVHWPSKLKPAVSSQVSSLVDVAPTVLSLAGLEPPAHMQGTDLSPVLTGDAESVGANAAFIETSQNQVGIRTSTHLYGLKNDPAKGRDPDPMLFDLTTDPMEDNNLAGVTDHAALESELRERAERWDRETVWRALE